MLGTHLSFSKKMDNSVDCSLVEYSPNEMRTQSLSIENRTPWGLEEAIFRVVGNGRYYSGGLEDNDVFTFWWIAMEFYFLSYWVNGSRQHGWPPQLSSHNLKPYVQLYRRLKHLKFVWLFYLLFIIHLEYLKMKNWMKRCILLIKDRKGN